MPAKIYLSHPDAPNLSDIRKKQRQARCLSPPDSKARYTVEYDGNAGRTAHIPTIKVSTQHDEFVDDSLSRMKYAEAVAQYGKDKVGKAMHDRIERDVRKSSSRKCKRSCQKDIARLFDRGFRLLVNPTGKFVIGGPAEHRPDRQEDQSSSTPTEAHVLRRRSFLREGPLEGRPFRRPMRQGTSPRTWLPPELPEDDDRFLRNRRMRSPSAYSSALRDRSERAVRRRHSSHRFPSCST